MVPYWGLADALLGGTAALRSAGETYLPKFKREAEDDYKARLKQTTLTRNMFNDAVQKYTGKVFSNPVVVENSSKPEWIDDIDMRGTNLSRFARDLFSTCLAKSIVHILVDNTKAPAADRARTVAEEQSLGIRPYFVKIEPEDLIAAYGEEVNGVFTLTHIRWRSSATERDGFDEKVIERIYVREPGIYQVWRKQVANDKTEWIMENEGTVSITPIPLVTFYAEKKGLMRARPPLESVAETTKAFWQTYSEYRNNLSACMFPIFTGTGIELDEGESLTVGPNHALTSPNKDAKLGWAEHTGAGVESGRKELEDLERRASIQATELMRPKADVTATGRSIDANDTNSVLQDMAAGLEDVLSQALYFMEQFSKAKMGKVQVNKDFGADLTLEDFKRVLDMYDRSIVSPKAVVEAAMRVGVLPDDFNYEEDQTLAVANDMARTFGQGAAA